MNDVVTLTCFTCWTSLYLPGVFLLQLVFFGPCFLTYKNTDWGNVLQVLLLCNYIPKPSVLHPSINPVLLQNPHVPPPSQNEDQDPLPIHTQVKYIQVYVNTLTDISTVWSYYNFYTFYFYISGIPSRVKRRKKNVKPLLDCLPNNCSWDERVTRTILGVGSLRVG